MKAPEHLVSLADSDEESMPVTATIRENGVWVRKQAGRLYHTRQHSQQ
jgi:hypothetical protein